MKSYAWAKVQASDPLVEPRLAIAIDHILQGEGWKLVDKNPSVYVSAVDAGNSSQEYARFYRSMAGYEWKPSWQDNGFMDDPQALRKIHVGTLIVDMYDSGSKKLVWRGTAIEPTSSETKEKAKGDAIDKTVATMFKGLPLKGGAGNQVEATSGSDNTTPTGTHP